MGKDSARSLDSVAQTAESGREGSLDRTPNLRLRTGAPGVLRQHRGSTRQADRSEHYSLRRMYAHGSEPQAARGGDPTTKADAVEAWNVALSRADFREDFRLNDQPSVCRCECCCPSLWEPCSPCPCTREQGQRSLTIAGLG